MKQLEAVLNLDVTSHFTTPCHTNITQNAE